MYNDLRDFISELEKRNLIIHIKEEVDNELEISEITSRVCKLPYNRNKALFFENVVHKKSNYKYNIPVVTNLFGSIERMKLALGLIKDNEEENFESIFDSLIKFLKFKPTSFFDKLKILDEIRKFDKYYPKIVQKGKCKEVIIPEEKVNLNKFPILKLWPKDGGRFITMPLVFTKDPETGIRNVGMYRLQIFDEKTTGIHWHIHKDGARIYRKYERMNKRMEVAVAVGCDPATIYSSTAPLPENFDEILFSGILRKKSVNMIKCENIDMEVPADSEIILEGYVNPGERKLEGPFGDHTGFYSSIDNYPVFHITCITHRENPIYPAIVTGIPPMEDAYIGKATERIFLPLIKLIFPEIVDINLPVEGVFHNLCVVSINKQYPGHAKKVIFGLWSLTQMMFVKTIIVVDKDVNVQNLQDVLFYVSCNIDPKRDVFIIENCPVDVLDHTTSLKFLGSKMGIDATRKFKEEGVVYPEEAKMDEKVIAKIDKLFKNLNL